MKLAALFSSGLVSAGLIAAAAIAPAPASAQRHDRVVTRSVHNERHRARPRTRQVCSVTYRHNRRVRTCRAVRY